VLLQQERQGRRQWSAEGMGRGGAGRQAGRQVGRLTGHWEQVLLPVVASAEPRKEPGRHWVQAWWEEGPTSAPWPQVAQLALTVKALRNRPLPQATQESGPPEPADAVAGTKPPLQGVHAAMPARGAYLLSVHAWHNVSVLGVRVERSALQKDTVPLAHSEISVRLESVTL
jgi:hypothetical protein